MGERTLSYRRQITACIAVIAFAIAALAAPAPLTVSDELAPSRIDAAASSHPALVAKERGKQQLTISSLADSAKAELLVPELAAGRILNFVEVPSVPAGLNRHNPTRAPPQLLIFG